MRRGFAYRLSGDGKVLAEVEGDDDDRLKSEIGRYSMQYIQDCGEVMVEKRHSKHWQMAYVLIAQAEETKP